MKFWEDHIDEAILFVGFIVLLTLYAAKPDTAVKGWVDNFMGALILALTGGGVKALIKVNGQNGQNGGTK